MLFHGTQAFRQTAADWYTNKFGIPVNPETEVLPLIGSQEGTAHLPLAVLNPGDFALLQDPGYPSHAKVLDRVLYLFQVLQYGRLSHRLCDREC